ncbi:MAG: FAD-dependent oxidoreductase [Kiritimatiellia bacterium]
MKTDISGYFDLIVVGAGTGGWPAAVGAARAGASVLLLEEDEFAGGAPVDNYITMPCGEYVTGVYAELIEALERRHRLPVAEHGPIPKLWSRWFLPSSFRIEIERIIAAEKNITFISGLKVQQPIVETSGNESRVKGALISVNGREIKVRAGIVIDATGSGLFAESSGAAVMYGSEEREVFGEAHAYRETTKRVQQCTLMYVAQRIGDDHLDFRAKGLRTGVDPEFGWLERNYDTAMKRSCGIYLTWGASVECADTRDETCLSDSRKEAMAILRDQVAVLHEHGHLVHLAPRMGVRECRRIVGEDILTESRLRAGKFPEDTIAVGNWFLDNWGGDIAEEDRQVPPYGIPLRAFTPKGTLNLVMACKAISISHVAFSSWRVQPTVAAAGQAVGVAGALAAGRGVDVRDLDFALIRDELAADPQGYQLDFQ